MEVDWKFQCPWLREQQYWLSSATLILNEQYLNLKIVTLQPLNMEKELDRYYVFLTTSDNLNLPLYPFIHFSTLHSMFSTTIQKNITCSVPTGRKLSLMQAHMEGTHLQDSIS